jgi:competence protein ComEC
MFKLRWGYFTSGIVIGLILFLSFLSSLPDGKLHIFFCDVGQGDGAYVRFPDGRDMVIDGGPNDKVIDCLGRHMPFWDKTIDMVLMTHPQKDHMQGLLTLFKRFKVNYFLRSDVINSTDGYRELMSEVDQHQIRVKYMTAGDMVEVGSTTLSFIWPTSSQLAKGIRQSDRNLAASKNDADILGDTSLGDLNDYSLVFFLRLGSFDVLFTGDADSRVEDNYSATKLADGIVEVLKVPHHGSKTGMNEQFLSWINPRLAVISVGKNSYGHPALQVVNQMSDADTQLLRTDLSGDIEVVADGSVWWVKSSRE